MATDPKKTFLFHQIVEKISTDNSTENNKEHYFISDLHLSPQSPHLFDKFVSFVKQEALDQKGKAADLYIIGDLFDFWIGDDAAKALNFSPYIEYLKTLTDTGLTIFVMHGNRDFLLSTRFEKETGCFLIPDPSLITINDSKILLAHGDDLCSDDISHQRFRRISRRYFPLLIKFTPVSFRLYIAKKIREKSKRNNSTHSYEIMDVKKESLTQLLSDHMPDLMIHGHTHRPMQDTIKVNDKSITRIVLSDW